MRSDHSDRIERFGLGPHQDDQFWARPGDLTGIGVLHVADKRGERMQVAIYSGEICYYLDTTNQACLGDLWNIKEIPLHTRVAFYGNVRSITERGVRLGRITIEPVNLSLERVVFTPSTREGGQIYLGEGNTPDPNPQVQQLTFTKAGRSIRLIPFVSNGFKNSEILHGN